MNDYPLFERSLAQPEQDIEELFSFYQNNISNRQSKQNDDIIELDLSQSNLSELPANFSKLSSLRPPLRSLLLDRNPQLGDTFNKTTILHIHSLSLHLTRLHLSYCGLKSPLPLQLFELGQLRVLHLNNNELTRLENRVTALSNLTELSIDNNQLTTIPFEIGNLPLLARFSCYNNPLVSPLDRLRTDAQYDSARALSLLRSCMEGTSTYNQIKLIFLGFERAGKVGTHDISYRYIFILDILDIYLY